MKKWLWLLPFLAIFIIWQAFHIYGESMKVVKNGEQQAIDRAKIQTNLQAVTDVKYYHGSLAYWIVYGQSLNNDDIIVWVPEEKDGRLLTSKANQGWSKEKVKQLVIDEQNPKEIIDIRLGAELMKDNRTGKTETTPLWEVTYIDQQNRYTYYFVKFFDGSFVKRYSLKKDRFEEEQ